MRRRPDHPADFDDSDAEAGEDFFASSARDERPTSSADSSDDDARDNPVLRDPEPRAAEVVSAVNAPIMDLSGRWERVTLEEKTIATFVRTEMPTHLDPVDWNAGFLRVHERELSPELFSDLRELVPQALLRDLHRPVRTFVVTPEEIEGTAVLGRWREGRDELKKAFEREPPPVIESTLADVRATQAYQRSLREEPWQPMFPDDAPRREIASEPPPDDDYE